MTADDCSPLGYEEQRSRQPCCSRRRGNPSDALSPRPLPPPLTPSPSRQAKALLLGGTASRPHLIRLSVLAKLLCFFTETGLVHF